MAEKINPHRPIRRMWAVPAALVLLGMAFIAFRSATGARRAEIHYEVLLRDGGRVPIEISYRTPSERDVVVTGHTPWRSPTMIFGQETEVRIAATTSAAIDSGLQCRLVSTEPRGAWVLAHIDDPLDACDTRFAVDNWPPDDDDLRNPLIKVG